MLNLTAGVIKKLKKVDLCYLWIFCITFFPRLIVMLGVTPLRTVTDEMLTIAGGAYFSGLDWSGVLAYSGRYYGSGFTMLFGWIFNLTDDPMIIYRIFLLGCVLLQAFIGVICYYILKNSFNMDNKKYNIFLSIACSYLVVTRATIVYNEHILIFLSWVIALILAKLSERLLSSKRRMIYTILLFLVMGYSLTIHTRAFTYWISLGVVAVLYFWTYRKSIISATMVLIGGVIGGGFYWGVELLKGKMYLVDDAAELYNATIPVSGIKYLFSADSWGAFLNTIVGQINTIAVATGGFLIIVIVFSTCIICKSIFQRKLLIYNIDDHSETDMIQKYLPITIFFIAAIAMTILAQSVSWLGSTTKAIQETESSYGFKAFTYVRYFGPYCGPILMILGSYMYLFKNKMQKYFKAATWLFSMIQVYWIAIIVPLIKNNPHVTEVFLPLALWDYVQPRLRTFLIPTFLMIILFCVYWLCVYKAKPIIPVIILSVLLMYQYTYNSVVFDKAFKTNNYYEDTKESFQVIKYLEEIIELPKQIHVFEGNDIQNQQIFYEYQFLLNRYTIMPDIPAPDVQNAVVLSNSVSVLDQIEDIEDYKVYVLNDKEYILIKGLSLINSIEESGIKL